MRFDFCIGRGIELLVADIGGDADSTVIEQHLGRDGRGHVAGGIGGYPAQKLLPEQIMRGVAEGQTHLPANCPGGHDCGAAMSKNR